MSELIIFKSGNDIRREARQALCDGMLIAAKEIEVEHLIKNSLADEFQEHLDSEKSTLLGPNDDWSKGMERIEQANKVHDPKLFSFPSVG